MAKLSPDYIQFVLSLSTSQAQQEIHKLEKASNELKSENKELRKSMMELTASGRRNSEEYRNLEEQYKRNNRSISENNAKTQELLRTVDTQNKSYKQLAQEAKRLRRELDNTVKALEPERYRELADQLAGVRNRMNDLRGSADGVMNSFSSFGKLRAVVLGAFAQMGMSITQALGNAINKVKEFTSESMQIAVSADGVVHAFEQLGRNDLLASLRKQTKGTISDLQIMTSLVRARDFRIPLDEMGKYLAFAQLKAQQTGQSIDYMVDSIVLGLGRKSLLILDNLGLSAAEIREKEAETGDFMQGVSAIMDKQLQQSGRYVSAADKVAAADVKMANVKLKLGRALSRVGDLLLRVKEVMADFLNSTLSMAGDRYEEQKSKVMELVTETEPLINRYEELKSKVSLTATEQEELNSAIGRIAQTIPSAITKFGEYGKAMEINSEQAKKFIATQKLLMLFDNRKAIAEAEKNISKYQHKFIQANSVVKKGGRFELIPGSSQQIFDDSPETLARAANDAAQYKALMDRERERLKELRGENLETLIESQRKMREAKERFLKMNRKQLETWLADEKNAQSEFADMAKSFLATKTSPEIATEEKKKKQGKEPKDVTRLYPQYKGSFEKLSDETGELQVELFNIYQEQERLSDYLRGQVLGNTSLVSDLFSDVSEKSTSEIQAVIDRTEKLFYYLRGGSSDLSRGQVLNLGISEKQLELLERSPNEVEALGNALEKLKKELGSGSPFLLLQRQLDISIERIREGDLKGGIEGIGEAVAKFSPAVAEFGDSLGAIFGDGVSEKIKAVADSLGGLGQTAGGIGRIMSGDVIGGAMSAVGGISKVVGAIGSLFGGADYSKYNEMVEKYENLLDIWNELLDAKKAYIDESYGPEAIKAGAEALNLSKNLLEVERKLAETRLRSGASAGSHSQEYRMWKGSYKWEGQNWRDVAADVEKGLAAAGLGDVSFDGMGSLLSMTGEQLQWIKENYTGLWSVMDSDFREHLENIVDLGDKEKEIIESVKEQLTGVSFDEFENSYMDMLLNLESGNEDFAKDFEKRLQQSILKSILADKYKKDIRNLYDTWAKLGEDGYTAKEVDDLRDKQHELTDRMLEEREQLQQMFGFSAGGSGGGQSASRGGFESMTQDQASELSGRFTALQESGYRLEGLVQSVIQVNTANQECTTEIRDILYESNGYLNKIEGYTKRLGSINELLEQVKNNTKNL